MDDNRTTPALLRRRPRPGDRLPALTAVVQVMALAAVVVLVVLAILSL
jgi:hypothetical protein